MKGNKKLAQQLWYISQLLGSKNHHSYQAKSFANASDYISRMSTEICKSSLEIEDLDKHKHIGPIIAKEIVEYCEAGKILYLEDLLESTNPALILQLSKGVGKTRSQDIVQQMNIKSYFDLQSVLASGHLKRFLGGDSKIYKDIEQLMLNLPGWLSEKKKAMAVLGKSPPIDKLLELDLKFRNENPFPKKRNELLEVVEPIGFYKIFYSDSESARVKSGIGDWVVIKLSAKGHHVKWIALTSKFGALKGKRIIAGREKECRSFYESGKKQSFEIGVAN